MRDAFAARTATSRTRECALVRATAFCLREYLQSPVQLMTEHLLARASTVAFASVGFPCECTRVRVCARVSTRVCPHV
eukprot:5801315-Pleurochrysis_carterae.AAC.3